MHPRREASCRAEAGFPHHHLQPNRRGCLLLQRQADSPASAGSDSESLGEARGRGGGGGIGEPTPLFEKHSSRGAHAPPPPTGPNPGPGGRGITRPRRGPFLGRRTRLARRGARVCHHRSGRASLGTPLRLRGPATHPAPRFLHTGGRAERRPPTDLRPPGPRRSRPTPRGRTRK